MVLLHMLPFLVLGISHLGHSAYVSDTASFEKNLTNYLEDIKNQSQVLVRLRKDILKHMNLILLEGVMPSQNVNKKVKSPFIYLLIYRYTSHEGKFEPVRFIKPKQNINYNQHPEQIMLQFQKAISSQLLAAKKEKEMVRLAMYNLIYKKDYYPIINKKRKDNIRFKRKSELKTIEKEYDLAIKHLKEINDKLSNVSNLIRNKRETGISEQILQIIRNFIESIGKGVFEVNFSMNLKDLNLKIKPNG